GYEFAEGLLALRSLFRFLLGSGRGPAGLDPFGLLGGLFFRRPPEALGLPLSAGLRHSARGGLSPFEESENDFADLESRRSRADDSRAEGDTDLGHLLALPRFENAENRDVAVEEVAIHHVFFRTRLPGLHPLHAREDDDVG